MSSPQIGDRINNYLLEEQVGQGSFGQVWRARHHMFDKHVAIKVPTDPQYVRNLQREGVAIHGLKHPNIVRAVDLDPYADPPYLIMEYVDGPSLRQVIDANATGLPIPAVVEIMCGLLDALTAAHGSGLIHRDIKPANILIQHPLDQIATVSAKAVKVTDFGLGRTGDMTTVSIMQSGSMLTEDGNDISGTIAYMAPEQKQGGEVDARSDLYSCSIVLFELLMGERPSGTELPGSLRSDVPKSLDETFRRSYTRLDRRLASAQEMLDMIEAGGRQKSPPPIPQAVTPTDAQRVSGRHRCTSCKGVVGGGDQFCIHCGHQIAAEIPRCASCRAFVHSEDLYCIFCGAKLRSEAV